MRVGIVGCGAISHTYLAQLPRYPGLELVAVTDLLLDRAEAVAAAHGLVAVPTITELLARDDVDLVCNLTVPQAHAEVTARAVDAGKHVYVEKPLAVTPADMQPVLDKAAAGALLVGCAPDTFLASGQQLARRLLDEGRIGRPVSATAGWLSRGHESWHPSADFYYRPGGGPLFDMGPYYLTVLVFLLGSVVEVSAVTSTAWTTRTLGVGDRSGIQFAVEVPTHVTGLLRFESGPSATVHLSFDVTSDVQPRLEVYGTDGTLYCPDPNTFEGKVGWYDGDTRSELTAPCRAEGRGIGLADLADAAVTGRPARTDASLALHVLEVMDALHRAGAEHRVIEIASRVVRPAPLTAQDERWLR